jgi:hypothetical protein
MIVANKEVTVGGRLFRFGKLRHEWCDFIEEPVAWVEEVRKDRAFADVFTLVRDIFDEGHALAFHHEPVSLAVLTVESYSKWWDAIGFKARNKARKAQKSGVELRMVELNEEFAAGVQSIYNETPVKQGRKFYHYGKTVQEIREELRSFLDRSILVGAYHGTELIGFMKLFQGKDVLRTIHIIASIKHRGKCAMDALIANAVEICEREKVRHLQYGSWTDGGVGAFREKYLFRRIDVPRYFVPLTLRGKMALGLKLHRPFRDRVPKGLLGPLLNLRAKWYSLRFSQGRELDAKVGS